MDTGKSSPSEESVNYPKYPKLEHTEEAKLLWEEYKYRHDLIWQHLIRLSGKVKKRKKKLSKAKYGTSHKVSLAEAKHIFETVRETLRS